MYVLGNPILGKNLRRSGLILNEEGLHKLVRLDLGKHGIKEHRFFLTGDINKILALMDLKLEDISDRNNEDVYMLLASNQYFRVELFKDKPKKPSRELGDISDFLIGLDPEQMECVDSVERLPIRTVRVEEILGIELREKIDHIKFVLTNSGGNKRKFQQIKMALLDNGYVPQNFSKDLPKFKNSFGDSFGYQEAFVMQSVEELYLFYLLVAE